MTDKSIVIETSLNRDLIASCDNNEANYKLIKFAVDILQSLDNRGTTFTIIRHNADEPTKEDS